MKQEADMREKDVFVTPVELAEVFGVTTQTVYNELKRLPKGIAVKVGRQWRINLTAYMEYLIEEVDAGESEEDTGMFESERQTLL
jgi:hypothetical protein